ncbi:hypothetical protein F503_02746 [Ophiostoma piceae UAMH 11346]|uniref:Uncharacterized protein n=1 Tax=Ophiostoma piceae (strain UAMH 11346) TaxID=1262450 RepID=S3CJK1_OPHP1|nr:hypothetical protein F503_02746 [Ophiostoma piceae UAMH 11346]
MTLPIMATQVDPLSSSSFRAFGPWRRRDASPGQTFQSYERHREQRTNRYTIVFVVPVTMSAIDSIRFWSGVTFTVVCVWADTLCVAVVVAILLVFSRFDDDDLGNLGPPEDSQRDHPNEPPPPPSMQPKLGSSTAAKSAQSTAKPGPLPAPFARSVGNGRSPLKRRRALSDVDGPNTGVLCCKKRRLRRFLITSRLSQPFSQPASHILNRESVASGDKRFLKLAAIMNARRIRTPQSAAGVPPPPEAVWRAAMANRFRKRIFADTAMGLSIAGAPMQLMNSARLTMVPMPTAASMAAVRASGVPVAQITAKPAMIKLPLASTPPVAQPVSLPTKQMAFVRPASPLDAGNSSSALPRRGRSHSRSPRLRPVRDRTPVRDNIYKAVEEDYPRPSLIDDEGDCAFPTTEHESRYEVDDYDDEDDRPDDEVYADFSVLFGSSGDDSDWGSGNEEGLDDYMDELDGIAHLPR